MTEQALSKSVLDNVPLICSVCGKTSQEHDKAFPCGFGTIVSPRGGSGAIRKMPMLPKIGACPRCGSPIYGPSGVFPDDKVEVVFSCDCRLPKSIESTMETK